MRGAGARTLERPTANVTPANHFCLTTPPVKHDRAAARSETARCKSLDRRGGHGLCGGTTDDVDEGKALSEEQPPLIIVLFQGIPKDPQINRKKRLLTVSH